MNRYTRWPDGQRLFWAFKLALDVEACADLLSDKPVGQPPRPGLLEARKETLVRLVRPIDVLERNVA
jgi:hypothetical protein